MRKKKIVFASDCHKANTGFGRNTREVLRYLNSTEKYDIVEYCKGHTMDDPLLERFPWKAYGTLLNNQQELNQIAHSNPPEARLIHYGKRNIDEVIRKEKPDIFIAAEDFWGVDFYIEKKWWNKINCALHVTLDSLPLYKKSVEKAKSIKNFFVWAGFAEREMHRLGHKHVKKVGGAIDIDNFHRLSDEKKRELRRGQNISENAFIIGYVFRNQLRKSVHRLLEAFKKIEEDIPNAYLLLHTDHANEPNGFDIVGRIKDLNINPKKVLFTHLCRNCFKYEVKSFDYSKNGEFDCSFCHTQNSQVFPNPRFGVTPKNMNEIYNLMDMGVAPFTSGGMEYFLVESLAVELPLACTNYSSGEDFCISECGTLPLEFAIYDEIQTNFKKAATHSWSIVKQVKKVFSMSEKQRRELGKRGRDFIVKNYSTDSIGKFWEDWIDSQPEIDWDFDFSEQRRNPEYNPREIENDVEWLKDIYKNILCMEVDEQDEGLKYWIDKLQKNENNRENILNYFKQTAFRENSEIFNKKSIKELFEVEEGQKSFLIVLKESAGDIFMAKSLLPQLKELHPNTVFFFACAPVFKSILDGEDVKWVPYHETMEQELAMISHGDYRGIVDGYLNLGIFTQRQLNYLSDRKTQLDAHI